MFQTKYLKFQLLKSNVFLILCLLNASILFSQSKMDSLKQVANTAKNDSIKIETNLRLLVAYSRTDADISLKYAIKVQELVLKNGFELGFANLDIFRQFMCINTW